MALALANQGRRSLLRSLPSISRLPSLRTRRILTPISPTPTPARPPFPSHSPLFRPSSPSPSSFFTPFPPTPSRRVPFFPAPPRDPEPQTSHSFDTPQSPSDTPPPPPPQPQPLELTAASTTRSQTRLEWWFMWLTRVSVLIAVLHALFWFGVFVYLLYLHGLTPIISFFRDLKDPNSLKGHIGALRSDIDQAMSSLEAQSWSAYFASWSAWFASFFRRSPDGH